MTEYDYSPQAIQRYTEKQRGVSNWVHDTNRHNRVLVDPFQSAPTAHSTFDSPVLRPSRDRDIYSASNPPPPHTRHRASSAATAPVRAKTLPAQLGKERHPERGRSTREPQRSTSNADSRHHEPHHHHRSSSAVRPSTTGEQHRHHHSRTHSTHVYREPHAASRDFHVSSRDLREVPHRSSSHARSHSLAPQPAQHHVPRDYARPARSRTMPAAAHIVEMPDGRQVMAVPPPRPGEQYHVYNGRVEVVRPSPTKQKQQPLLKRLLTWGRSPPSSPRTSSPMAPWKGSNSNSNASGGKRLVRRRGSY
ncbi:hypothetical protein PLICRDRAFT_55901 [Plicaturopsis crispa FD-325 SS-3]|nr:hypothetical protein PLICRDRAFT_55901 [Plicaturopsis crispa FD-325 SS-3]